MTTFHRRLPWLFPVLLTACTALGSPSTASRNGTSTNVHGVNYTADPFRYVITDPNDPTNSGGGEHIGPFSAGGIMCCYRLPRQWVPGTQVQIRTTRWVKKDDGKLQEIKETHTVEVPRYAESRAGELWVLLTKEGTIDLVESNVQPDHPEWPGRVKGWPEPSIEYQRERWELYKNIAEDNVNTFQKMLAEFAEDPDKRAQLSWAYDVKYGYDFDSKKFSGPDDPAYRSLIKKRYEEGIFQTQKRLQQIMSQKP